MKYLSIASFFILLACGSELATPTRTHQTVLLAFGPEFSIGNTEANLKSAVEGETYEYTQMYPGMAKTARDEGFAELAEWFETLAKAERSHANRFTKGLESLKQA